VLLSELFTRAGVIPNAIAGDAEVATLVMDSRKATPGCCFVCMPSESGDSHRFLPSARDAGATAAIVHSLEGLEAARSLGLAAAFVEPTLPLAPMNGGERGQGGEGLGPPSPPLGEGLGEGVPETPEQRIRRTTGGFSEAMWRLAKVAFGDPSTKLKVIGVTGTNGKTTTAWLIRDMLNLLGIPCAYIGTLGFGLPFRVREPRSRFGPSANITEEELRPLANTTPFSIELNAMLAECVERGCQAVAMEVSSHALAERRVDGVEFDVAIFTNLSQDHLDYHGTMEAYEAAKWRLFSDLPLSAMSVRGEGAGGRGEEPNWTGGWGKAVPDWQRPTYEPFVAAMNMDADGAWARFDRLDKALGSWLFSRSDGSLDLELRPKEVAVDHLEVALWDKYTHDGTVTADDEVEFRRVRVNLGGDYNVENLASAIAALHGLHIHLPDLVDQFEGDLFAALRPVPGRFEPVPNDSRIGIIVDYAHTPDALEKLLATVRPLTKGRVITVFGCGGDRDKSKRPLMARAAQAGSDVVVVTSDNPRTEDPMTIIDDIRQGLDQRADVHVEPDRPAAVALALRIAEQGDTVVIAGKGHEDYQIIGREKMHMDDRELAREGLRLRELT